MAFLGSSADLLCEFPSPINSRGRIHSEEWRVSCHAKSHDKGEQTMTWFLTTGEAGFFSGFGKGYYSTAGTAHHKKQMGSISKLSSESSVSQIQDFPLQNPLKCTNTLFSENHQSETFLREIFPSLKL